VPANFGLPADGTQVRPFWRGRSAVLPEVAGPGADPRMITPGIPAEGLKPGRNLISCPAGLRRRRSRVSSVRRRGRRSAGLAAVRFRDERGVCRDS